MPKETPEIEVPVEVTTPVEVVVPVTVPEETVIIVGAKVNEPIITPASGFGGGTAGPSK